MAEDPKDNPPVSTTLKELFRETNASLADRSGPTVEATTIGSVGTAMFGKTEEDFVAFLKEFEATASASRPLRDDFEQMLRTAEQLQESCDRYDLRNQLLSAVAAFYVIAGTVVSIAVRAKLIFVLVAIAAAILALVLVSVLQRSIRRRLARDQRALGALVGLMRETQIVFLTTDVLTPFERAQFEIRLSRLDIGVSEAQGPTVIKTQ